MTQVIVLRLRKIEVFPVRAVWLAFTASYEVLERITARATGEAATAFLDTQLHEWDLPQDMFLAFIGAITRQIVFQAIHHRELVNVR